MRDRGARKFSAEAVRDEGLAAVFLATPPEVSMELTPALLEAGAKVIDLSGAFRLGTVRKLPALVQGAAYSARASWPRRLYGLPEFYRSRIPGARLVSNPGCYPTAANLAIKPLVEAGVVVREAGIVCDAKSGVSGAGRKPSLKTSFCEVTENFSVYSVLNHRHVPEVLRTSGLEEGELSFTAQLLPIDRGILETIYFRARGVSSAADLLAIYRRHMRTSRSCGSTRGPGAGSAGGGADEFLRYRGPLRRYRPAARWWFRAIDNLVKGAAGQAVQNMNLLLGFPETAGLLESARVKLLIKLGGTLLDAAGIPRTRWPREIAATGPSANKWSWFTAGASR